MLTPYILDERPQSEILNGEYKDWAGLLRGQLPQLFPLKAITPAPPGNEQILLADRNRWSKKEGEAINAAGGISNAPPPGATSGETNQPPSTDAATKPAAP